MDLEKGYAHTLVIDLLFLLVRLGFLTEIIFSGFGQSGRSFPEQNGHNWYLALRKNETGITGIPGMPVMLIFFFW